MDGKLEVYEDPHQPLTGSMVIEDGSIEENSFYPLGLALSYE